ncbi:MAG: secretin N-terminal domain-containing protein, partial [Phycisphaeraceae bacterium]
TDRSANIRRVVTIVSAIDTAISSVASVEVFPLQYANAADAARLINEIFSGNGRQGQEDPRAQFARMMRGRRGGGDDDDDSGSRVDAPVNAAADERTNTLVVTGSEDTLVIVADVLADLDANPAASQGVFVYQVRNGQADNLHAVLDTLFNAGNSSQDARDTRRPRGGETEPLSGRASSERREEREAERPAPQPRQQELEDPRQSFRERMMAQMAGEVDESATDLLGQVQIVSDMDTNSLLVMTSPANFEQVRKIIEQLDRPMPQVVIKALIAEVTHSDDLDLGAEFSILNIPEGSDLFTDFGLAAATGGMTYRLLETDIQATIRALQEVGKLEVLSRPYILASDNQEAIITVGSEVPFITSTSFTELGGSRSTVRYEDIGIILRVTPQINADGIVTMDVFPEISAISGESIEISPGVRAPVI